MQLAIEEKLRNLLHPTTLVLTNESEKHKGHEGYTGTSHWQLTISSPDFEGVPLVKCHQIIYDILKEELKETMHALSINILHK